MMYHVGRGTEQLGQFSTEEIQAGLSSGQFLDSDLVWREGMSGWQPLGDTLQLVAPSDSPAPLAQDEAGQVKQMVDQPKPFSFDEKPDSTLESAPEPKSATATPPAAAWTSPLPSTYHSHSGSSQSSSQHVGVGVMPVPGVAIASLVLGLIPVLACPIAPITSIVGVVLGHMAIGKYKNPNFCYDGKGLAIAGLVLNYVWLVITVLAILFFVAVFAFGAAGSGLDMDMDNAPPTTTTM